MKKILLIFAILLMISPAFDARASHVSGVDMSYTCLGPDTFLIRLKVWRDCGGIDFTSQTINLTATSSCAGTATATLQRVSATNGIGNGGSGANVSQLCARDSCCSACIPATAACTPMCTTAVQPGYIEYLYEGIIVLNPRCDVWTIGYSPPCCRNTQALQNTNQGGAYIQMQLNTATEPCNNSPQVGPAYPIAYACLNSQFYYDYSALDVDGDSLVFFIDTGYSSPTNRLTYTAPYFPGQPITGINLDPQTGIITFNPVAIGAFVVPIRVEEYRIYNNEENVPFRCSFNGFRTYYHNKADTIDLTCFSSCNECSPDPPTVRNVTFQVDLRSDTLISNVHLAGSFNSFSINSTPMASPGGDSIYTVTIGLPEGTHEYKFVNNNILEPVFGSCANGRFGGRTVKITGDTILPVMCFSLCDSCFQSSTPIPPTTPQYNVTFRVDMTNLPISPQGVFIAGDFNNWSAVGFQMTNVINNIYSITIPLDSGVSYQYRFLNGLNLHTAEKMHGPCAVDDGFQNLNREVTANSSTTLPLNCFGSCVSCLVTNPITFRVDMRNHPNPKDTMSLISNFQNQLGLGNNFTPGHILMLSPGPDSIYYVTLNMPAFYMQYKFINGLTFTEAKKVGYTMRDMQFRVIACSNSQPSPPTQGIVNLQGQATQVNSTTIETCEGNTFSFDIVFTDPDPGDSLEIVTNLASLLPGSNITFTGANPVTMSVNWTAVPDTNVGVNNTQIINFTTLVKDNNCPIPGISSGAFTIRVNRGVFAGPDHRICRGDTAQLLGFGRNTYTWNVLTGEPFNIGVNVDCIDCAFPKVNPQITTTYELVSTTTTNCPDRDTVTVFVGEVYTLNIQADTVICFNDSSIEIFANPSLQNTTFTWQWDNPNYLDFDSVRNPTITPILSKTYNVTVESNEGCTRYGSVNVGVTPPFPPVITASALDSFACQGLSTTLDVSLGELPTSCGLSASPCVGLTLPITVGTGTTSNGSGSANGPPNWPTPYGASSAFLKTQFLIRAADLNAAGINAGKLTSLAFDVTGLNGSNGNLSQFQIQMGCTGQNNLTTWQGGLSTVFAPKLVNVNTGWNTHTFDTEYDYDGTSNLIVQICFANNPTQTSSNISVRLSNVGHASSLYFASNNTIACLSPNISWPAMNERPNMQFGYCPGADPAAYNYSWFPTTNLSNPNTKNPSATVSELTEFFVVVTDTFGACFDTTSVTINIAEVFAGNDTAVCINDTFQLNAQAVPSCPGNVNVRWSPSIGLSNDSILNPLVSLSASQQYVITSTDDCNCTVSDTIFIEVIDLGPPDVTKILPDCNLPNGQFQLGLSTGIAPYQFSIDGGQNYQADSLFTGLDIGFYLLHVIDSIGCPSDTILDTLVNPGAPFIDSVLIENLKCYESADGSVELFASGGVAPYIYSIDSGTTFQTASLFSNLTAGNYMGIGASLDTCKSFPFLFEITQPDSLYLASFESFDDTCYQLCDGYALTSVAGGTPPYVYLWQNNASDSASAFNYCAGDYTLIVTDSNDCLVEHLFNISEPDDIVIDSINVAPITCFEFDNGIIRLHVSGGTGDYLYSIDGGNNFFSNNVFDSLPPGFYNIVVKDEFQCEVLDQVELREPSKVEVQTVFDSTIICINSCIDISAIGSGGNGGPYSFSWSPSVPDTSINRVCPDKPTNYAVFARDPLGCTSDPAVVFVDLYNPLSLNITPDTAICSKESLDLFAIPFGGDGLGYNFEWTPFNGLNNPLLQNPTFNGDNTTTYTVKLTDNCGTPPTTAQVTIQVNPSPDLDFFADKEVACQPGEISFINNSANVETCEWTFGDGKKLEGCLIVNNVYRSAGVYSVALIGTSAGGCKAELLKQDLITINRTPTADFKIDPEVTSVLNTEIEFQDLSRGSVIQWDWNFAGLGGSTERNAKFIFPNEDTATYPIKLTVTSPRGCSDDTIKYVRVSSDFTVFVPNAFTPQATPGLNDLFKPVLVGVQPSRYLFRVFDRWGKTVFETTNPNEGWDGSVNGELSPNAVYVWKIILGDYTSENDGHQFSGRVTVIR